jgi:hypothetical protein
MDAPKSFRLDDANIVLSSQLRRWGTIAVPSAMMAGWANKALEANSTKPGQI